MSCYLEKFLARLSVDEAFKLYQLLSCKFDNNSASEKSVCVSSASSERRSEKVNASSPVSLPESCNADNSNPPVLLLETLFNFWDFENSEYVKKRQLRGFEIKQRNCKEKLGIVRKYWATYFDEKRTVQSLTSRELDKFLLSLRRDKGLSADTETRL